MAEDTINDPLVLKVTFYKLFLDWDDSKLVWTVTPPVFIFSFLSSSIVELFV